MIRGERGMIWFAQNVRSTFSSEKLITLFLS